MAVQDEFTAPAARTALLQSRRGRVRQLFGVCLSIMGALEPLPQRLGAERIWVRLRGESEAVRLAKEYVKGVCEPELQDTIRYPKEIHCIFAGAQSVFLDSLIRDTCADVSMTELGTLGINGSEEAVVLAQSRIQQFVELFESNKSLPIIREPAVKKCFKSFVETRADKYTMDLLLLPSSLKEELLNLTSHAKGLEPEDYSDFPDLEIVQQSHIQKPGQDKEDRPLLEEVRSKAGTPVSELTKQMDTVLSESARKHVPPVNGIVPIQESTVSKERPSCKRRCSDAEERRTKKQFSFESGDEDTRKSCGSVTVVDVVDLLSDSCSDFEDSVIYVKDYDISEETEYKILVNFFKTMGYSREIVEKVIAELGQSEEPLKLLDVIEREHKRVQEEKETTASHVSGYTNVLRDSNTNTINVLQAGKNTVIQNGERTKRDQLDYPIMETQHSVQPRITNCQQTQPKLPPRTCRTTINVAVNTASTKQNTPLGQVSSTGENGELETDGCSLSNSTVHQLVTRKGTFKDTEFIARGSSDPPQITVLTGTVTLGKSRWTSDQQNGGPIFQVQQGGNLNRPQTKSCPSKCVLNPEVTHQTAAPLPAVNVQRPNPVGPSGAGSRTCLEHAPVLNIGGPNNPDPFVRGSQRFPVPAPNADIDLPFHGGQRFPILVPTVNIERPINDPSVTGSQRFFNIIKVPYKLELQNKPGRADLKHIIIDGSNVAMRHGLDKYFSCRGIALAVEYFWNHGHRNITVFVPQWRTKRDPNIKEQNFLLQLQDLGILSFTPARMVLGARISSHDDRFLLHLSERTGGIIVTNDNFKEFVTESPTWKQIIKERILQYTFVGDIFMVPDDPLGRHGPRLQDFVRQQPPVQQPFVQQQPHFQPAHFQQAHLQQPRFSNLPPACLPVNNGLRASGFPRPAATANQPWLKTPAEPRPCWTPQLQKVQPHMTIPPQRTTAETTQLREALLNIFPDSQQRQKIGQILSEHPYMRDLNALSAMVLD